MSSSKKRYLSGIKPTGTPHIGNYVGMLRPMVTYAAREDADTFIFVPDYHALNNADARKNLGRLSYELVATLLALGFDPSKCTFFRQSDVMEVFELTSFLTNFTPKGMMNRAHAYKAIVQEAPAGEDVDIGVNMGLYNYPILMAADILLYDTDLVPIGRDQRQHLEFARDMAGSVNAFYNADVLKLPEAEMKEDVMELPGLDGRKMSKSYGNTLPIFAPADDVLSICKKIKTDSKLPAEPKEKDNLVYLFYKALATPAQLADFEARFLGGGMGYGDAKKELAALHESTFATAREEYLRLLEDKAYIVSVLHKGAEKARAVARPVLERVKRAAGLVID